MTGAAIALAVIGTATTVASVVQSHKATEATKKSTAVNVAMQEVAAQRARAAQLRQARLQRARVSNMAEQTGTSDSSGEIGAEESIGTQTNANLSFLDTQTSMSALATSYNQQAADASSRSDAYGTATNLLWKGANMFASAS